MRILLVGMLCLVADVAGAQTVLKREPLALNPGEVAYVDDGSCNSGKVAKITGAMRGLHRKKTCIALEPQEAALRQWNADGPSDLSE